MINTSAISTGFDVELQLGGDWFSVALRALIAAGAVTAPPPAPPGTPISVLGVEVLPNDLQDDLEISVLVGPVPVTTRARLSLSADGSQLLIETDLGLDITVPFGVLSGLASAPLLTKVAGGAGTENAMVVLANLDIRASDQAGPPLAPGSHLDRGDESLVGPFLPAGRAIAFGVGRSTFPRLANDIWHTQLTADDGSHPLPDEDDKKGSWQSAAMESQTGRIRLRLDGVVPVDLWPDADVDITVDIRPRIEDGGLVFDFDVDSDVDTGVLGDIFAFFGGGLVGLIIGALLGGALTLAGIGAVLGVIILEVGEAIVEGEVNRQIKARLDDEVIAVLGCDDGVIVNAVSEEEGGLALRVLDAIPCSIPVFDDNPDPLHTRHVLVTTQYEDLTVNANGFAAAGSATIGERFVPLPVTLVGKVRGPDDSGQLSELVYEADGDQHALLVGDVLTRVAEGALAQNPVRVQRLPQAATKTLLDGTLASVCLRAQRIRRAETVITDIEFASGLDLRVEEAVMLQDSGVLVLEGLQLIHPGNANPYYRSRPNQFTEDNLESLPTF